MTLVCATHHQSVPLLIGDVLISGRADKHAEIATFDKPEDLSFRGSEKIVGVAPKLVLVTPKLAVGWSGIQICAANVIRSLRNSLPESPTLDDLTSVLDAYHNIEPHAPVDLVGSLVFPDERFTAFQWNGPSGHFSTTPIALAGSGIETFGTYLAPPIHETEAGNQSPLTAAVGWAYQQIGFLLASEIHAGENLTEYFGGGFDVAFYDGASFRRVASVVELFSTYKIAKSRATEVSSPERSLDLAYSWNINPTMFWQSVTGRKLVLERIDLDQNPWGCSNQGLWLMIKSKRTVEMPFSDSDLTNTHATEPKFLIIYCVIAAGNSSFCAGCAVYRLQNLDFRIWRSGSTVRFRFSPDFIKSEGEMLAAVLDSTDLRQKVEIALSRAHQYVGWAER